MTDIEPVVIQQDARYDRRGNQTRSAGWVVQNNITGKRMGLATDLFATREEAGAAIPRLVEFHKSILRSNKEADAAAQAKMPLSTDSPYRTVHSSLYGEGRRYHSQPGATQYDDGSGRFNVQIWDES